MKRKILIGCAISGAAVLTAGIGIGVACAVWHSKPQATDVITLDTDKPTLALINEEATITAVSSLGKTVSLSATIDGIPVDDINIFNPATGTIRYTDGDLECQTIVVTAEDGFAVSQSVSVGFGQIPPNPTPVPPNSLSLYAATLNPNSYNQGVATKIEGDVTEISFNTYDNPTLAISLKDYTNDDSLV
ncbi:hypothetical protein FACS1894166_11820 [Bacilli bacterium]|nr:hypothetical protein FACS1894166_11820 [Bacilli bacterium]